jgi:REP element-mobilizing transposase RayT
MSRPLRLQFPHAVYHVTSRGNARQRIYEDRLDREQFLSILAHVVSRYGWLCHAYCLMDNHYHLVIETPKANVSLGMRHLNGLYTQTYNRRHGRVGHLLQGRYTAIVVEKDTYLLELCRYVVLNPVRAKAVKHPRQWRWSSYGATVGQVAAPKFLTVDWVLGQFEVRKKQAQARYRQFVAEGMGAPRLWVQLTGQIYLGSEGFVATHQPDAVIREIPRQQTQATRPSLSKVFAGHAWKKGLLAAYRRYGYRMQEIADHVGVHYSTVSRQLRKVEVRDA